MQRILRVPRSGRRTIWDYIVDAILATEEIFLEVFVYVQNSFLFTFRYVKWIQSSINYLEVNEQERRSQHATENEDEGKGTFN